MPFIFSFSRCCSASLLHRRCMDCSFFAEQFFADRTSRIQDAPLHLWTQPRRARVAAVQSRDLGYHPNTNLQTGLKRFVKWYLEYYAPSGSYLTKKGRGGGRISS